jgi:NAD(P)-dependent dehydrogenase (short-subunit alcohol dehydrogenase family)
MTRGFAQGEFHDATLAAIEQVNALLREHFPADGARPNELPDSRSCSKGCFQCATMPAQLRKARHETYANKVAIVTGASQGIGLPAPSAWCGRRARDAGRRAPRRPAAADALGDAARFFRADVSQKADVDALVAATLAPSAIDILINNAGVTHAADFLDLAEEDFDRVLRINLKSMFLCSQAVAREMVKRQSGCIINMSSVNAELAIPNQVPYVVSKGGVNQLTRVAAIEPGPARHPRQRASAPAPS